MNQESGPTKPVKNLAQALVASQMEAPSPEEMKALEQGDESPLAPPTFQQPQSTDGVPEWCPLPAGMVVPEGRQVFFLRLRASWTDTPHKGERTLVMWNLASREERLALQRTRGDATSTLPELTKQAIRVVDGQKVDWSKGAGSNIEVFWEEIGAKCRDKLVNLYLKNHSLTDEETADFFGNCIAVRTTG